MRLNFFRWFENLKTQAKLLTVFGLVGIIIAAMAGVGARANRMNLGLVAAAVLLALIAVQFGYFAKDYFSDYRVRSSAWLGGNLRGALEALIDLDARVHPAGIYFSTLQSTG